MSALLTDRRWRMVLIIALVTAFAGVALIGVSAWFLAAVAVAGLGPAAFAFNFHVPAGLVRLLALVRTGGKYAERTAGHRAALNDQLEHRRALFERMASSPSVREAGWQLARTDDLRSFIEDVASADFERLRAKLPLASALVLGLGLFAVALIILPVAALAMAVMTGLAFGAGRFAAKRSVGLSEEAAEDHRRASGLLGHQLQGLVALEAEDRRAEEIGRSTATAASANNLAARARSRLKMAEGVLAALGPGGAAVVLLLGFGQDVSAITVVGLAFAWLAFAELLGRLPGIAFAQAEAKEARARLDRFAGAPASGREQQVDALNIDAELRAPTGRLLGQRISFIARRGQPTAVLGPSGCGKTTLLKAIAGWLPAADGEAGGLDPRDARESTHLSLHDAAVLTASVRENLLTDADDAMMWQALENAELAERIRAGGGLDAPIGPETLSMGETRRLALARAFLSDKPVLLLDEPGEHLGQDQAARILKRLLAASSGKVVVYVTHDEALAGFASATEEI